MTVDPDVSPEPPRALDRDERIIYARLRKRLSEKARVNRDAFDFYEGSQRVRQLDIAVPPHLQDLQVVAGWAGTAVDVIEERLDWDNFTSTEDLMGLDEVYRDNNLDIESSLAQLDALIAGTSFVTVGTGDPDNGEPPILVTPESPNDCTILWDYRARRGTAALSRTVNALGFVQMETLYLLNQTITLERVDGRMVVTDRDQHDNNRIPVSPLVNRGRTSRRQGRSEMTKAVRYLCDAAVRTLLGMEINREFYTTPQRWVMGADMDSFETAEGAKVTGFEAIMGHMLAYGVDEETGEKPTVGQFAAAPPTPYIEQVRGYSMFLAAEAGIPASYLGYASENPTSADAIRAGEVRLIKRSERRQKGFNPGWLSVAYNILLWRDGEVDRSKLSKVRCKWRDPATPTRQAAADEATKLVSARILPADSTVTWDRIGLTADEQVTLANDQRRARAQQGIADIAAAAAAARAAGNVIPIDSRRGDAG